MLFFPNAKINIGLNILKKRDDGYHEVETLMYPIKLNDALEISSVSSSESGIHSFEMSGIIIESKITDNLVYYAYNVLGKDFKLKQIDVFLHKAIPYGAGLGGGSSDASFMLKLLNYEFCLGLNNIRLKEYASIIGSDSPFFIDNVPVIAKGRGEILKRVDIDLKGYYILLVVPNINVGTAEAYEGVSPSIPIKSLSESIKLPISEWKNVIKNDFEKSIFQKYPEISNIKSTMYKSGAVYASLSGSGSAVYGIFENKPIVPSAFDKYFVYEDRL